MKLNETLGSFSTKRCNWTKNRMRTFCCFYQTRRSRNKFFCYGRVREWRNEFSRGNFIPSVVNLKFVHTIVVLFAVTLHHRGTFTFLERSHLNMYVVFVKTWNKLIDWSHRNVDPWKEYFEHKNTEFVTGTRLRACRRSKFNRLDPRKKECCTCKYIEITCKSVIIRFIKLELGYDWNICKRTGAIYKYTLREREDVGFLFVSFEPTSFIWTNKL